MGFTVIIRNRTDDFADAEFDWECKTITIYKSERTSKVMLVLRLIHEIAHLIGFIKNKRTIKNHIAKAYGVLSEDYDNVPKRVWKSILIDEQNDLKHWDSIVEACDIKIPKWRIDMQKELDICIYELYYLMGSDCPNSVREHFDRIIKKGFHANKRPNTN